MVYYCCVPQCNGRVGGHKFPRDPELRLRWRIAIRRKCEGTVDQLWEPQETSRVCHRHFTPEDYKPNRLRKLLLENAVPSVFNFTSRKRRTRRSGTPPQTIYVPALSEVVIDTEVPDIAFQVELGGETPCDPERRQNMKDSTCSMEEEQTSNALPEISHTASQTSNSPFYLDFEKMIKNAEYVAYYTGLQSFEHFLMLFNLLCPAALDLDYKSELGPKMELFIVLTKLRRSKGDKELGFFFNVHQTTISQIVITWINFLYMQFKEIDTWASGDTIRQFSPVDFRCKFPRTRVILDATEVPIAKPKNVLLQSTSFSHYKNKNTMKCIVGISPRGAVTFISDSYGGSTSDRQIVERSRLLTMFDRKDSILVDRGLTVQDLFATNDVKVDIPTFLRGRYQLDVQEVSHDRKIASKRIHVERVIGLAKKFKILDHNLDHSKRALAGRIIYVCFSLVNFMPTIVDEYA